MAWLILAVTLVAAYLIGSINGAVIVSKAFGQGDVRKEGSGNAGMTNMIRQRGIVPGLLTFLIDMLKGTAICLVAKLWVLPYAYGELGLSVLRPEYAVYYCAIFCIIGHIFPVFFGFKGGKGVSTTLGVGFVCCWKTAVVALSLFLLVFIVTRIISVSSLTAAVSLPILNIFFATRIEGEGYAVLAQVLLVSVMSLNIIVSHRTNIVRLIKGEEKKLTVKKKEPKSDE